MKVNWSPAKEKRKEANIEQDKILAAVKDSKNFIVNAGAGAGKTYSMVKLINDISKTYEDYLFFNNKKILCITYTNTAKDEMLDRIKSKKFVHISTIHSFVWFEMKDYQGELKKLVVRSMSDELLLEYEKVHVLGDYTLLSESKEVIEPLINEDNISKYYEISNLNARGYKDALKERTGLDIRNVANTKKIIRYYIRKQRYERFINDITLLRNVKYDELVKVERLDKSRIDHDRVIEYFNTLCEESEFFRTKIASKYPFVLIDEFQDTNPYVVKAFKKISDNDPEIVIGMFGDPAQAIYENGVGIVSDSVFEHIEKKYNWRSTPKLVSISNLFRIDRTIKESVFDVFDEGNFSLMRKEINTSGELKQEIDQLRETWGIEEEPVHVFINRINLIANINGFKEIYDVYRGAQYYRIGTNYLHFNDEFMNFERLSTLSQILYGILKLRDFAQHGGLICEIIPFQRLNRIDGDILIRDVSKLSDEILKINNCSSLLEYIDKLYEVYSGSKIDNNLLHTLLRYVLVYKDKSEMLYSFNVYLNNLLPSLELVDSINRIETELKELYLKGLLTSSSDVSEFFNRDENIGLKSFINSDSDDKEYSRNIYDSLINDELQLIDKEVDFDISVMLNKNINQFDQWYQYIKRQEYDDESARVIYQTLHSSKGREYDNVVVLLEKGIRSNTNEFHEVLKKVVNEEINDDMIKGEKTALNLLYVGLSRARKNLCLIYNSSATDMSSNATFDQLRKMINT